MLVSPLENLLISTPDSSVVRILQMLFVRSGWDVPPKTTKFLMAGEEEVFVI
jgi:hypothetical protein